MIPTLALSPSDRVLVFAPHPDDESVGTGGLLQHAIEVGSPVQVVYFTDGDNNAWAQRASEVRWRIGAAERARFGIRRRGEASRALETLGLCGEAVRFLGFPDQGATDLLLHSNRVAMRALACALSEFRPTVVVGPSMLDLHPDHSALAVMVELAIQCTGAPLAPRARVRYLVHNPTLLHRQEGSLVLPLSDRQRARKRSAIACHRTQLVLRSSWLLAFARPEERFYMEESAFGLAEHPVRRAVLGGDALRIEIDSRNHLRALGPRTLCIVARAPSSDELRVAVKLPTGDATAPVTEPHGGAKIAQAGFRGRGGRGEISLPASLLPPGARVFAKVERRFGFFDEAGWKELPATAPHP